MSKKAAIIGIVFLLVANLAAGLLIFYKSKVSADSLANSTIDATSKLSIGKAKIPTTDVQGEDFTDITRFKGAVRTGYAKANDGSTTIQYKAQTTPTIILDYYKSQLAKANWILLEAGPSKIEFLKNNAKVTITATEDQGITTLDFSF